MRRKKCLGASSRPSQHTAFGSYIPVNIPIIICQYQIYNRYVDCDMTKTFLSLVNCNVNVLHRYLHAFSYLFDMRQETILFKF